MILTHEQGEHWCTKKEARAMWRRLLELKIENQIVIAGFLDENIGVTNYMVEIGGALQQSQ